MLFWLIIQLLVLDSSIADDYNNEYGPSYGEDWQIFTDENDEVHYIELNISDVTDNNRGIIFGDVYYFLYSRDNEDGPEEIEVIKDPPTINSSFYDPAKTTKIITHGWRSSGKSDSVMDIAKAYLESFDHNVITVDWSEIATNPIYPWAAASTRWVGKEVANLITALRNSYNVTADRMHLIGHSLGAQVMGNAGTFVEQNVSRITGLDPARPLFEFPYFEKSFALESGDAIFVDIIHTCGGLLGYEDEHGHADFYPNDGHPSQPGCAGVQRMLEACSHSRSYKFFAESIYNADPKFVSYRADSWKDFENNKSTDSVIMGEHVDKAARGRYYLYTESEPKYAKGDCQARCQDTCC